tara:strand:+ start:5731 stop:6261 length:531 start_codon:yes stop_codon:yes gene_type:complete
MLLDFHDIYVNRSYTLNLPTEKYLEMLNYHFQQMQTFEKSKKPLKRYSACDTFLELGVPLLIKHEKALGVDFWRRFLKYRIHREGGFFRADDKKFQWVFIQAQSNLVGRVVQAFFELDMIDFEKSEELIQGEGTASRVGFRIPKKEAPIIEEEAEEKPTEIGEENASKKSNMDRKR